MSEDAQHSRPKGWKAFQVNYDYVFSLSNRLCSYCLTDQQVAALLSMTEYLQWPTRWVRAGEDVDPDFVTQFTQDMERRLMSGCCDDNLPIQYRYTDDGILQRSLNAGGNWTDASEYDPRVYSTQFPPMSGDDGDDKKCVAATGAAALIKEQVGEQLTDDMTRYTLSQLINDWVKTFIQSANPLEALLTVVANQIFALVIATLRPALTDTVYHILQCILYCNMANDASFNLAQWQAVRDDITSQIGGIAGIFLEHLVYLLGTQGLTNLARAGGAADGDCSDCNCNETCAQDWQIREGLEDVLGHILEQTEEYVIAESTGPLGGSYYIDLVTTFSGSADKCCYVTSWEFLEGGQALAACVCGTFGDPIITTATEGCFTRLQTKSNGYFKVKFNFASCP